MPAHGPGSRVAVRSPQCHARWANDMMISISVRRMRRFAACARRGVSGVHRL